MDLKAQKVLAEKFRAIADDKAAVTKLADDTTKANMDCDETCDLCARFKAAADGAAVKAIADEVKAKS